MSVEELEELEFLRGEFLAGALGLETWVLGKNAFSDPGPRSQDHCLYTIRAGRCEAAGARGESPNVVTRSVLGSLPGAVAY